MDITKKHTDYGVAEDRSWLGSQHGADEIPSITLDVSAFTEGVHYPTGGGLLKSGMTLGRITASGLYGPYSGLSDEVQTLTEGGSGLTSFTITYSGQTTASIDDDATAAQVQAALEALSNIAPGDVTVTGGPLGTGPFTVTFGGTLADTNVAAMTTTPTGGTGTVVVATATAGAVATAADGRETFAGHLLSSKVISGPTAADQGAPLFEHGAVYVALLPANHGLDTAARTAAAGRIVYR